MAYTQGEEIRLRELLRSLHDNRMIPQIITKDDGSEIYKIYKKQEDIPYSIEDDDEGVLNSGFQKVLSFFKRGKNEGIKISKPSDLDGQLQEVGEIHLQSNGEENPFGSPIAEIIPAEGLRKGLNEVMLNEAVQPAIDIPFAPSFSDEEKKYIRNFFSGAVLSGDQILLEDSDGHITNFKNLRSEYILTAMLDTTQKVIIADENGNKVGSVNLIPQGVNGNASNVFNNIQDGEIAYNGTISRMTKEALEDIATRREREALGRAAEEGDDPNAKKLQQELTLSDGITTLDGFNDEDDWIKETVKSENLDRDPLLDEDTIPEKEDKIPDPFSKETKPSTDNPDKRFIFLDMLRE